jgi:glycosyltransferase involved in cell wall biosynthesis
MQQIKILYVITSLGLGGAEKLLLSYVERLNLNKYKFFVCTLREKPNDLASEIAKYAELINLNVNNRFDISVVFHLRKLIKKLQPDIIHTHLFQARIYTSFALLFTNRPASITHKHNSVNLKKHNIFILLEMLSLIFYDRIIAISQSVKRSLYTYEFVPKNKVYILSNGIDYSLFSNNSKIKTDLKDGNITLGTVCRLEPQKGIRYLLLAMKTILAKFPDVKLEIIGTGSLLSELQTLSVEIGISNSVKFLGKFTDVIPFYKRMDIFVLPSLYEGFGIVILEAMAMGIPVVATNVDGIKEVLINDESGILIPPKNPEAIANVVNYLIDNPQIRERFSKEGKKRASLFDIKDHLIKLDKLYSDLLRT